MKGDLLINSTGDGTIGRVAVYNFDFPAIVDGHITVVRFKDPDRAWYAAAYFLTLDGRRQIARYINGSSGQVEIYPPDIRRLWVKGATPTNLKIVANDLRDACEKHDAFHRLLRRAIDLV